MGQCNFLHLWHQKLYRAFRFGTLWPISCSYPRHSQLTRHSLMLANGRIRQSLTALVISSRWFWFEKAIWLALKAALSLRGPLDNLISTIGFPIMRRQHLYILKLSWPIQICSFAHSGPVHNLHGSKGTSKKQLYWGHSIARLNITWYY